MALPLIPLALRYGIKKFGPKALKALNIGANVSYGIDTAKQIKEGKTDNLEALSTVSALKVKAPILKFYDIVTRDKKFGTSAKTKSYILRKKKVDDIKDQTNQYAVTATGRSATGVNKKYKTTETRSQIRDKKTPVAVFSKETGEIFGDPTKLGKEGVRKTKPKFSKKKESIGRDVKKSIEVAKTKGDTAREIEQMRSTIAARLDDRKAKGDMKGTVVLSDKDRLVRKIYSQEAKKRGISLKFATVPKVTKGDLSGPPNPKLGREFATAKLLTGDKKFRTTLSGETKNIYYGTGENKQLSNLALRPFEYGGKKYKTVEHAYQTLKSGKFDPITYSKNWKAGTKIRGATVDKNKSAQLMENLITESFKQNPKDLKILKNTATARLTHKQDKGFFGQKFPEILMKIRNTGKAKTFVDDSEKLRTLGQQTAVLRYIKKGRIAKEDTAILGFHEQKIPKNISASTTYVKTGSGERTINTSPIYDPKTKKQAVKTVIDKESGGEYDVKQFNKKTIKTIETQAVKTDEKLITTPRNVIGATYRSLKNKGYTAKLIREKLNTKLSGRK